jgi:hypothetical protein
MTGMVKEEILTRQAELGLTIEDGYIIFNPLLVDHAEFLTVPSTFTFTNVMGNKQDVELVPGSIAYSLCQTPIILQAGGQAEIQVNFADGRVQIIPGHRLNQTISRHVFQRDGAVQKLIVKI